MRITRQAAPRRQLLAKVRQLLLAQSAFKKRASVDARRGVSLKVNLIRGAEEVVERHLVERSRRGVGRDVAADAWMVAIGADHHRHGVPADEALDPPFDLAVARVNRLSLGRD